MLSFLVKKLLINNRMTRSSPPRRRRRRERSESPTRKRNTRSRRSRSRSPSVKKQDKVKKTENVGEISCSIEETNKLRISLGLKPLNMSKPKQGNEEVVLSKTKQELEAEKKAKELKEALEKSKKRRELNEKLAGKSLGELLKEETKDDALDWVQKSRMTAIQAEKEKKRAAERAKLLDEQDQIYQAKDLKGMKIAHDVSAFHEDSTVILTLKDTRVLDESQTDLNQEAQDELENVNISEADRRVAREKAAKRARQPVYSGYDDEEFVEPGKERKAKILSQYDQEEEAETHIVLGEDGAFDQAKLKRQEAIRERLKPKKNQTVSLTTSDDTKKELTDYYTKEEMVAFAKPKKLRKKKKRRKKDVSIVEELKAINAETTQTSSEMDHGSRDTMDTNDSAAKDLVQKRKRFEIARQRANEKAAAALKATEDAEVETELDESLAHARRVALLKARKPIVMASAADIAKAVVKEEEENSNQMKTQDDSSKQVVFSEATDFEARVRTAMEERKRATEEASNLIRNPMKSQKNEQVLKMEVEEEKQAVTITEQNPITDDGDWGVEQPLVGSGMAATLALLRSKGDLRESTQPRLAGRQNDYRDKDDSLVKDGVKLEYRDEFGRPLTKKEAFRQLSYKFHGQKPGKKKQEKRLKALKEEIAMDKALTGEGSSATMKALERRQKKAGQAFVFLSRNS